MHIAGTGARAKLLTFALPKWKFRFDLLRALCNTLSELLRLIFVYVFPYRKKVIEANISRAFPSVAGRDKSVFLKQYYRHLSELFTEFFLIHFSALRGVDALVRYENPGLPGNILNEGSDVVVLASHCGNWEYLLTLPQVADCEVITAYSPVSWKWLDKTLKQMRSRYGMKLVGKQAWYKYCLNYQSDKPAVYLSITDQRPVRKTKETVSFMNQKTFIQSGGARLAEQKGAVTFYLDVRKNQRNVYSFRFIEISDGTATAEQIMNRYFVCLETTVRRQPELWLWSHNRWKFRE
jgi:KDO2-lipid IV(A) lauroyltransferase